MKSLYLIVGYLSIATFCFSQSIERDVVACSGDYYEGAGISLSWTLGEVATETYANVNTILTQGFQQPGIILRIYVDLTALLEGPFNGTDMNTDLSDLAMLPVTQPYNTAPWNYAGTENLGIVPLPNKVDWVLIELRDAPNAATATPATMIGRKAALIMNDGSVVNPDGSSNLEFSITLNEQLFVVIWHRNHLGMMSALPLTESAGVYTYNFTTSMGMAYMNGQKSLDGSVYGMYAGDANADGSINELDKTEVWINEVGQTGYLQSDMNLDAQADNQDKNNLWYWNRGKTALIPQ